ncbi:MAG: O-antigen ligase family protein [Candidatus Eremiobacteraeota bacterium]|nr:O-antigen ligase family protein [Candidatus Eremiobacteraeota bacterium]
MRRLAAWVCAAPFAALPLFPSFITLTAVTVPGVSLIPPPVSLTLLGLMVVAVAIGFVLLLRPPRDPSPMLVPLSLWWGAGLLAALLGFNPAGGLLFIGIFGMGIVWHSGVWRFFADPTARRAMLYAFLVTGALAAAAAIAMLVLRQPADQYTIGNRRAIGTFILPGELAGYLIIYLPIACAVASATRDRALRAIGWTGTAVGLVAFALTISRAGWMGMAAAIAFYLVATQGKRARYALIPVALGAVAVLAFFNVNHNPSENYTRISIWQAALGIIERFPLTGVGPFDFASAYALVRLPDGEPTAFHAHSFLLTIFAEMGLVGLVAVLWAWWRFAIALRAQLAAAKPAHVRLALAVGAGLVGTLVQGLIDTVSVVLFGLWLLTMALALVFARDGIGEDAA